MSFFILFPYLHMLLKSSHSCSKTSHLFNEWGSYYELIALIKKLRRKFQLISQMHHRITKLFPIAIQC